MELFIMIVALSIVALFTYSIAYINLLDKNKIQHKSKLVQNVLKNPGRYIIRAELAITTLEFLISGIAVEIYARPILEYVSEYTHIPQLLVKYLTILITIIVFAYFTTIFGKYIPKYLAIKNGSKANNYTLLLFSAISVILLPFTIVANVFDSIFNYILKTKENKEYRKEEFVEFTNVEYEKGNINKYQKDIINKIERLTETRIFDVYEKLDDVISIEINASLTDIISLFKQHEYSRIPVYENAKSNIIGVLYIKDLLYNLEELESGKLHIKNIIRKPLYETKNVKLNTILRKMQEKKVHIVVVSDKEVTLGIFTFNEAIKSFIGDVRDEFEVETK